MTKALGILIFVLAIWTALEVYTQGVDGAFGGRLAFLGSGEPQASVDEGERSWAGQRAADAFERAKEERLQRFEDASGGPQP